MPLLSPHTIDLLASLAAEGSEPGPVLLLRHSARTALRDASIAAAYEAPLTAEGREMAWRLGEVLPRGRPLRLYYSPVPRCRDTAHIIRDAAAAKADAVSGSREVRDEARTEDAAVAESSRGAREAAGAEGGVVAADPRELPGDVGATIAGPRDWLGAPFFLDPEAAAAKLAGLGLSGFVGAWVRGEISPDVVLPQPRAAAALLAELLRERDAYPGALHVHVTHDLTVMALLGLAFPVGEAGFPWPGFLEGCLLRAGSPLELVYRGEARSIDGFPESGVSQE